MAQFIFDTKDPDDVQLLTRLVTSGLISSGEDGSANDLRAAVAMLMQSISKPTSDLIWYFMHLTRSGPTTLDAVAAAMAGSGALSEDGWTPHKVKSRKMSLGRTVKKVQREFPGMPDPIEGRLDPATQRTTYTMSDTMYAALREWYPGGAHEPTQTPALEAVT